MTEIIIEMVFDGDLQIKNEEVPYSTSPREVLTVSDMLYHYNMSDKKNPA